MEKSGQARFSVADYLQVRLPSYLLVSLSMEWNYLLLLGGLPHLFALRLVTRAMDEGAYTALRWTHFIVGHYQTYPYPLRQSPLTEAHSSLGCETSDEHWRSVQVYLRETESR